MYSTWGVLASFPVFVVYVTVICECQEMLDPYGVIQQKLFYQMYYIDCELDI